MSVFLTKNEVDFYSKDIEAEFESLVGHRWFSARRKSKQWAFFRHCFDVLMGKAVGDFACEKQQAIQYKYEITDRLRRYYYSPGERVRFIFSLEHEKHDGISDYEDPQYPASNGYLLRITLNEVPYDLIQQTRAYLERVVAEAVDAEWAVYSKLPELNLDPLLKVFDPEGSAYKRIRRVAEGHHKKQLTICNDFNPSTKRLIDVKVVKLTSTSALVRTSEYWLLYWWSIEKGSYINYVYNELNRQEYFLVRQSTRWVVRDNHYPAPKTSTPRRSR